MTLFDINGISSPSTPRKSPSKLEGGIGAANLKFYESGGSSSFSAAPVLAVYPERQPPERFMARWRGDLRHRPHLYPAEFDIHYVPTFRSLAASFHH